MTGRGALLLALTVFTAAAQTNASRTAPPAPRKPAVAGGYGDLKFPDLRPIPMAAVENVTLPNGMRLMLLEDHELPLVNGIVLVRTGSAFDPPEKIGLAALAAHVMLEGGSSAAPGQDLARRFQDLGADVAGNLTENSLTISFSALKETANPVLEALKDDIVAPDFPQDRLDLVRIRTRNSIAHRNDDPFDIVRRELTTAVYGKNSPYGAQVENAGVDRINRSDLVAFHKRYFFPKNVILALDGDFDAGVMKGRIEALFDDWNVEQAAVPEFPPAGEADNPGRYLAVKKDLGQAYFAMGQKGGDYRDADGAAMEILCDILGNGPDSRLRRRLGSVVEDLSTVWIPESGAPGIFRITGRIVNPFVTPGVLRTISQEIDKMRTGEVSDAELNTARNAAVNSMVVELEGQLSILPRLAEYAYFGLPADYLQQRQKALGAVTRADVLHAALTRLNPAKMATVVAANPITFEVPLDSLGGPPVIPIDLTIAPPKTEAALGDAVSQRRARQMLARAQQAMGGADKLAAVTDYVAETGYQFDSGAGGAHGDMTERWVAPEYLRQDTVTNAAKYSVYYDGKTGWVANANGAMALADVNLKQMQGNAFRVPYTLLLSDRAAGRKVNALDETTVEVSDAAGRVAKIVFDPATGLPASELYDVATPSGPVPVIETYSDYREVNGVKVAYKTSITLSGKKYQEATINSIRLNTGLKIADLGIRP